jgi:hypothetical protein
MLAKSAEANLVDVPNQSNESSTAFVPSVKCQRDVIAEYTPTGGVLYDCVEAGQRIRRYAGLPPLDDVSIVIVVGGLLISTWKARTSEDSSALL